MKETKRQKRKVAITTIESLLTDDSVRDAFDRMAQELPNITDMICVYRDREGSINWKCTGETTVERIVSMIEIAKFGVLTPEEGEERE